MKSKTSFFNAGVSKNLLRRCWPLWAGYFGVLLLTLPGTVYNASLRRLGYAILSSGQVTATYLSFAVGILTAMALFSFLYGTRSCGMMSSLPIRRETLFCTVYLTGLVPLLAADLLTALFALLFTGLAAAPFLLEWLAMAALGNLAFYGFAVFCAMLTGSTVILPAVYLVLNLTAYVAEECASGLMTMFVYGFRGNSLLFRWLSPIAELIHTLYVSYPDESELAAVTGWGSLAAYGAVGLALSAAALWLYSRRSMETATDTVAIPVLKPLFRYCMSVGSALVFAFVVAAWIFGSLERFAAAAVIALLLVAGAVLGWYAAEMLLQKTLRVFRGPWKGCALVCCVLAALTMCLEFDLFGIERYVPDLADLEAVSLDWATRLEEPENMEKVLRLNEQVIGNKRRNENAKYRNGLSIVYFFKNGRTLNRYYTLDESDSAIRDPASDVMQVQELVNLPEAVRNRSAMEEYIPLREDTMKYVRFENYRTNESFSVPQEQAYAFVRNCLQPDMEESTMNRYWYVQGPEYYERNTDWSVVVYMSQLLTNAAGEPYSRDMSYYYVLQMDAERCMAWIKANTELDIQPISVTNPDEKYIPRQ